MVGGSGALSCQLAPKELASKGQSSSVSTIGQPLCSHENVATAQPESNLNDDGVSFYISSLHGWRIWPLFAFFRFLLLSSKEFYMSRSVSRPSFTFEILLCNGSDALVSVTVSHVVPFTSTIAATR